MFGRTIGSVALMVAASTVGAAQPVPTGALDSTVARLFALEAAPGIGVVVVRDTQIVYMKGFGMADVEARRPFTPQTVFYIASTTKSFTGLTAAILDGQGRFRLDAPLGEYLPKVKLQKPLDARAITIRSLLTHTHGIAGGPVEIRLAYTGEYTGNAQLIALLAEHAPLPNRDYRYSNIGYNIAALAMDTTLRESWKDVLQRVLFAPLGMTSTSAYVSRFPAERLAMPYRSAPQGFTRLRYGKFDENMQSAGGLVTTLADMGRWLEVHINGGRLDGRQVLPAAAVAESHQVLARVSGRQRGLQQVGYGLGWQIALDGRDTLLVHGGGFPGFATHMSFMPQERIGVAVFANTSDLGSVLVDLVAREVYATMRGTRGTNSDSLARLREQVARQRQAVAADLARRAARPQTLPLPLTAYAGRYESPALGTLELRIVNGRLEATMGRAWSAVEAYDAEKHQLRVELTGGGSVMQMHISGQRADSLTLEGTVFRRSR